MDELPRVAADHLLGQESQDRFDARTHLGHEPLGIGDDDQVLGGFKDAAAFFGLLAQRPLGSAAFGHVVGDRRYADDLASRILDRRDAEQDFDQAAILVQPDGFLLLDDLFAATDLAQRIPQFVRPLGRHDQADVLSDGLRRRMAEHLRCGGIPAGNGAVEGLRDDCVVRRFHRCAIEAFALREVISCHLGQVVLLDLAFQLGRLGLHLAHHARKSLRQHAHLAAGVERNGEPVVVDDAFDCGRQLLDRPGQRSCHDHRQGGRAQHGDEADHKRHIPDPDGRSHQKLIGDGLDDCDPFPAGQQHRCDRRNRRPSCFVRQDLRAVARRADPRDEIGEAALPVRRAADLRTELERGVRMNEKIALPVDHIDQSARPRCRSGASERGPHVEIDPDDAERSPVGRKNRHGHRQCRNMLARGGIVVLIQNDRRDVGLAGLQRDRLLEEVSSPLLLQLGVRNQPRLAVRTLAVDPDDLPASIVHSDQPHFRIGWFDCHFGEETVLDPFPPDVGMDAAGRIYPARPLCAHQARDFRKGGVAGNVPMNAGDRGPEFSRDQP